MPEFELTQLLLRYSSLPKVIGFLLGAWLLTRLLRIWFNEQSSNRSRLNAKITFVGPVFIWLAGFVVLISSLGVSLTTIGNIVIASGLVIGIVITPAASNAVAGFLNAWGDVFRVGEVLEIDDVVGRVVSRRMMSTRIETIDGSMYDIPNKLLLDQMVHNFTRIPYYRIRAEVHIDDPGFDLRQTEEVLGAVVNDKPKWNRVDKLTNTVRRAQVRYHQMAGSSHVFHVYGWIENRMVAPLRADELLRECALALEDANISFGQTTNIGFPFGTPFNPPSDGAVRWPGESMHHRKIPFDVDQLRD